MLFFATLLPLLALVSAAPFTKRYTGAKIQSGRDGKCLSPNSNDNSNGVPVVTVNCDQAKTWDINPGSGSVILHGTNFALDAGTGSDNNEGVKVRSLRFLKPQASLTPLCTDLDFLSWPFPADVSTKRSKVGHLLSRLFSWFLTGDQRIAITGGNQCLDEGDNGPQT